MNLKVLMVVENNFPSDFRVLKEARSIKKKYNVYVLCYGEKSKPSFEIFEGIYIFRLFRSKFFVTNFMDKLITRVFLYNPLWAINILYLVLKHKIDIIHLHDLPLFNTVQSIKPSRKIILDLHENWPAALKDWNEKGRFVKKFFSYYIHDYNRWFKYEKNSVKKASIVLTAADEMKQRICGEHFIESSKVYSLPNFDDDSIIKNNIRINKQKSEFFDFVYLGSVGEHRGFEIVLKNFKNLNNYKNCRFIIIGEGKKRYIQSLKNIASSLQIEENIVFKGYLPFNRALDILVNCKVGLIPAKRTEHTDNTTPHKLFQMMSLGMPILCSNCIPLERYVTEANCGKVFIWNSDDSFIKSANNLISLTDAEIIQLSNNARKSIINKFNWNKNTETLMKAYDCLV